MFRKLNFLIISFVLFSCTKQNQDLNLENEVIFQTHVTNPILSKV